MSVPRPLNESMGQSDLGVIGFVGDGLEGKNCYYCLGVWLLV